jgi:hypothetical protein
LYFIVTREYQKLLAEKERELSLYKEACVEAKIEVASVKKMDRDETEEGAADSVTVEARLSSALREKRLVERAQILEKERDDLRIKVIEPITKLIC